MKSSTGKEEINMAGSISFANWRVCYFISTLNGDGLKVNASFNGKSVIANAGTNPGGGVYVKKHPKGWIEPEHIEIWAKFQCGNYQYIHRYVFYADGRVDVEVGLGGKLIGDGPERGHIHNFYFRFDLDIDGSGN